jgi:nicotinamide-nucleotide amidase
VTVTETLSPALPDDVEDATHCLLARACERELTIATAESCTGGLLASLLTDVDGAGHAFERGFVVYTEAAKTELLGVPADMLAEHGAVSEPVAIAMAEGALARSDADIALSVTGFAGRGAEEDEAGLVHFGCAAKGRPTAHREMHFGDIGRGAVRLACIRTTLEMLEEALA